MASEAILVIAEAKRACAGLSAAMAMPEFNIQVKEHRNSAIRHLSQLEAIGYELLATRLLTTAAVNAPEGRSLIRAASLLVHCKGVLDGGLQSLEGFVSDVRVRLDQADVCLRELTY